jgi:hypothetical protein
MNFQFLYLNKTVNISEAENFWWHNQGAYGTHKINHNVSIHSNNNGDDDNHLGNKGKKVKSVTKEDITEPFTHSTCYFCINLTKL